MSSPISIHWCSLVPDQNEAVRSALRKLFEKLRDRFPDLPQVELLELSSSEQKDLPLFLGKERGVFDTTDVPATLLDGKRVFVFCAEDYSFAEKARDGQLVLCPQEPPSIWNVERVRKLVGLPTRNLFVPEP